MKGSDLFHQRACREPFIGFHPSVANFFRDYLSREKAVKFGDHFVINTHFPPFPGKFLQQPRGTFRGARGPGDRRLYFSHARRYQPVPLPLLASLLLQCATFRPDSRQYMEERFKNELAKRARRGAYNVVHDYIMCTAQIDKESEANIE